MKLHHKIVLLGVFFLPACKSEESKSKISNLKYLTAAEGGKTYTYLIEESIKLAMSSGNFPKVSIFQAKNIENIKNIANAIPIDRSNPLTAAQLKSNFLQHAKAAQNAMQNKDVSLAVVELGNAGRYLTDACEVRLDNAELQYKYNQAIDKEIRLNPQVYKQKDFKPLFKSNEDLINTCEKSLASLKYVNNNEACHKNETCADMLKMVFLSKIVETQTVLSAYYYNFAISTVSFLEQNK